MVSFLFLFCIALASSKVYNRCELARELLYKQGAPKCQIATWVCIAQRESQYNTSAVGTLNGNESSDHGIFQINDKYWCSPPGTGRGCRIPCALLEDDDITDDFICAQKIFKEHKIISGDGFNAWAVYKPYCKGDKAAKYIKNCFNEEPNTLNPTSETNYLGDKFFDKVTTKAFVRTSTITSTSNAFFKPTTQKTTSRYSIYNPTSYVPTTNRPNRNRFSLFTKQFALVPNQSGWMFSQSSTTTEPSRATTRTTAFSTRKFFTFPPTTSRRIQANTSSNNIPNQFVFIFNGVKWYK